MKYQLIKGKEFGQNVVIINDYDDDNYYDLFAFGLKFTDEPAPKGIELTDLSNDRDGSIVGWMEDNGVFKVSTQTKGQKVIFNEDCKRMFEFGHERVCCDGAYQVLSEIDFEMIDTSNVVDMSHMFAGCEGLEELDLSNFDTSNVTNMRAMFWRCYHLTNLDLSNLDTNKVTNMEKMFASCRNLKELNLSNFDTSHVKYMTEMFDCCQGLTNLDLSDFDTSKVTSIRDMFDQCGSLKNLKTMDKQLKNIYEEWVSWRQNHVYPNIDFKKLKMDKTNELDAKEFGCLGEICNDDDLPF